MKSRIKWLFIVMMVFMVILPGCNGPPQERSANEKESAAFSEYTMTVLNPQGHVKKDKVIAARLDSLEGKKIAMWLTATPDQIYAGKGAELYDILEKMLREKYSNVQIVRYADLPMKFMPEDEVVDAIVKTQPDAVVAGFGG